MNRGPGQQHEWQVSSAFFRTEAAVRDALLGLLGLGLPRDLIEIVVLKKDEKLFTGSARAVRPTPRAAGAAKGALIGLIVLSIVSALLIAFSGGRGDAFLTFIMLLGPNVGVVLGAVFGFFIGSLDRYRLPDRLARVLEDRGILMVVRTRTVDEAGAALERMVASGGEHPKGAAG